jgi:hypothetical protein
VVLLRLSYEFNIVPERIAEMEAIVAGNLGLLLHGSPSAATFFRHAAIVHLVRNVRTRRPLHVVFHPDVHLESPACIQMPGLLNTLGRGISRIPRKPM